MDSDNTIVKNGIVRNDSMVLKYAVLTEESANSIDINDPRQIRKLKLYDDLDEAKLVCTVKDMRHPEARYAVYVLEYVIYLFKKYKESEIQNGQTQMDT